MKALPLNFMRQVLFPGEILTDMMGPLGPSDSTFANSTKGRKVLWNFKGRRTKTSDLTATLQKWDRQIHTQGRESPDPGNESEINSLCTVTGAGCT